GSDRYQCRRSLWHWRDKRADRRGVGCRSGVSRSPGVWNDHRGKIVLPSRGQPIYRLGIARRYQGNLGTRSRGLSKRKIPRSGARPTTYTGSKRTTENSLTFWFFLAPHRGYSATCREIFGIAGMLQRFFALREHQTSVLQE